MSSRFLNQRWLKYGLNGVFIAFFVFWFTRLDLDKILELSHNLRFRHIGWFALSYLLSYAAYGMEYRILFGRITSLGWRGFFSLICSSSYANFIVPGSGEAMKIYVLNRTGAVPAAQGLLGILTERALALMVLLFMVASVFLILPPNRIIVIVAWHAAALLGAIIAGLWLAFVYRLKLKGLAQRFSEFKPVARLLALTPGGFSLEGSASFWNAKTVAGIGIFAAIKFLFDGFRLYFVLRAIGYDLSYVNCLGANLIVDLAVMIPLLPGSFGAFEFVSVSLLHYGFGVPLETNLLAIFLERILSTMLLFLLSLNGLKNLNVGRRPLEGGPPRDSSPPSPPHCS